MYLPLAALVVLVVVLAGASRSSASTVAGARARRNWRARGRCSRSSSAALAVRTVDRNRDYASPLALWQSVVDRRPQGRARFGARERS